MKVANKSSYEDATFFEENQWDIVGTIGGKDKLLFVGIEYGEPLVCRMDNRNTNNLIAVPFASLVAHTFAPIDLDRSKTKFSDLIRNSSNR